MYIIYFDICAILITMVFIISTIIKRNLKGRNNYLMFAIIILTFIASLNNLGNSLIANYATPTPTHKILVHVFNDLYFISHNLILPVYIFFIYSTIGFFHVLQSNNFLLRVWTILTAVDILAVIFNIFVPVLFSISDDCIYKRGPLIYLFYAVALVFFIWGTSILFKYKEFVRNDKFVVLILLYLIVIITIAIQFFIPTAACEMYGTSIALMAYIIVIQSSEIMVDPLVGAMKYSAGIDNLYNVINTRRPSTILLIKIVNNGNILMYLGQDMYNRFLFKLSEDLRKMAKNNLYRADLYYLEYGLYGFLSDEDQLEQAYAAAEEIRNYMSITQHIDDFDILIEPRFCIIQCPDDFEDFQTMFTFATSFHNTLPATRNIMLYSDFCDQHDFRIRNDLDDIIERAIKNDSFEMYYQPIYSTEEKCFVSAEALIRLKDETYGYISPSLFIPFAETNGSIHAIGNIVLEKVFKFMSNAGMLELGLKYIEINLSASQCIESDLFDKIEMLLDKYALLPEQISLELTETAADIDPEIVDQNVRKLHNLGIRFALDDYGTGYSNVKRMTSLPIDQVKLDKSYVDEIDDPQMWIVVQDTIAMLKEMGKEVLIEGVESEEAANRFINLKCDLMQGCEYIQGFYFCKPLPEKEFIQFINEHK